MTVILKKRFFNALVNVMTKLLICCQEACRRAYDYLFPLDCQGDFCRPPLPAAIQPSRLKPSLERLLHRRPPLSMRITPVMIGSP
jgi:hypothetical protein